MNGIFRDFVVRALLGCIGIISFYYKWFSLSQRSRKICLFPKLNQWFVGTIVIVNIDEHFSTSKSYVRFRVGYLNFLSFFHSAIRPLTPEFDNKLCFYWEKTVMFRVFWFRSFLIGRQSSDLIYKDLGGGGSSCWLGQVTLK